MNSYLTKELVTKSSQLKFQNYLGLLPNPDKILNKLGKSIEIYRDLLNDPHVWSCVQSRKAGILALDYIISPNDSEISITNLIEQMLSKLDIYQIISDILDAVFFGYQPMEIVWEFDKEQKIIYPLKFYGKPQEWFGVDENNNWCVIGDFNSSKQNLPDYKFVMVVHEKSYLNPYGTALLSKCYWSVTFKNGGLRFWVNYMEKYGMPILIGQYSRGATMDESRELAESLADMTQDAVIVTPSDIEITLKEAARSSSSELYRELIKNCNNEISKTILSQTLTTEIDSGSYSAAQTHFKIRREILLSDAKLVENTLNQLIKYIIELNFKSKTFPKFKLLLNDSDNLQKVERDIKLSQVGVKFTKKYLEKTYGLSDDEFELGI